MLPQYLLGILKRNVIRVNGSSQETFHSKDDLHEKLEYLPEYVDNNKNAMLWVLTDEGRLETAFAQRHQGFQQGYSACHMGWMAFNDSAIEVFIPNDRNVKPFVRELIEISVAKQLLEQFGKECSEITFKSTKEADTDGLACFLGNDDDVDPSEIFNERAYSASYINKVCDSNLSSLTFTDLLAIKKELNSKSQGRPSISSTSSTILDLSKSKAVSAKLKDSLSGENSEKSVSSNSSAEVKVTNLDQTNSYQVAKLLPTEATSHVKSKPIVKKGIFSWITGKSKCATQLITVGTAAARP